VKLGQAIVKLVQAEEPPVQWGAGTDAVKVLLQRAESLRDNALEWRELSESTDIR
jgi:hypothetical protein